MKGLAAPMRSLEFARCSTEMRRRADAFLASMRHRRTVRHFSSETIPIDVVRRCIETAALAP
jgi:hypothetical protein